MSRTGSLGEQLHARTRHGQFPPQLVTVCPMSAVDAYWAHSICTVHMHKTWLLRRVQT
jgi:hypothetical protein